MRAWGVTMNNDYDANELRSHEVDSDHSDDGEPYSARQDWTMSSEDYRN